MIWWVLSYLDNWRPPFKLTVLAATRPTAHLFMKWAKIKPARRPVYKRVRGVYLWCGYEYIWDTPNLVEQSQPGITREHIFAIEGLAATDPVWYYLFSIGEYPYKECQSALFYVPPPEVPVPSARLYHSVDQAIPGNIATKVTFDSALWDSYHLYDPDEPTKLTVPAGGLFLIGAHIRFASTVQANYRLYLRLNDTHYVAEHNHPGAATSQYGTALTIQTLLALHAYAFLQVVAYHTSPGARNIYAIPTWTPEFWITMIGPYPVSPP